MHLHGKQSEKNYNSSIKLSVYSPLYCWQSSSSPLAVIASKHDEVLQSQLRAIKYTGLVLHEAKW